MFQIKCWKMIPWVLCLFYVLEMLAYSNWAISKTQWVSHHSTFWLKHYQFINYSFSNCTVLVFFQTSHCKDFHLSHVFTRVFYVVYYLIFNLHFTIFKLSSFHWEYIGQGWFDLSNHVRIKEYLELCCLSSWIPLG